MNEIGLGVKIGLIDASVSDFGDNSSCQRWVIRMKQKTPSSL